MKVHIQQIPPEGLHLDGEEDSSILDLQGEIARTAGPIAYSLDIGLSDGGLFATGTLTVPHCDADDELRVPRRAAEPFRNRFGRTIAVVCIHGHHHRLRAGANVENRERFLDVAVATARLRFPRFPHWMHRAHTELAGRFREESAEHRFTEPVFHENVHGPAPSA